MTTPLPSPLRVNLLPAHPCEGGQSMDRHWRELVAQIGHSTEGGQLQIFCPLNGPPQESVRRGRFNRMWNKYAAYPLQCIRLPEADITHILDHSFASLIPFLRRSNPLIATLHDLAPLHDAGGLSSTQVRRFHKTCMNLRKADLVICDSSSSAEDARKFLGLSEEKLRVLFLGVDIERFSNPGPLRSMPAVFNESFRILSVGSALPRKNLEIFPQVLREVSRAGVKPSVIRVGQPLSSHLKHEIETVVGPERLIQLSGVPDSELCALYEYSDAFFMPSHLEGFGLPVLEAMAAGCPVVCSNVTSLPEVAGEAGLLFAPDDFRTAGNHLVSLAKDSALSKSLEQKGRLWAAKFSWQKHSAELLNIYRSFV